MNKDTPKEEERQEFIYEQPESGEWVQPIRKGYKMACCDCGLVHKMDFKIEKQGKKHFILFRVFRDNRATRQLRKHIKSSVINN